MSADVSQLLALAGRAAAAAGAGNAVFGQAVSKNVQALANDARNRAPKLTGALAASITGTSSGTRGLVEAGMDYSAFVEFGSGHGPPQPYMNPAADAAEGKLATDLETAVSNVLGRL